MVEGYLDLPEFLAHCKAFGREIKVTNSSYEVVPFGRLSPQAQLEQARQWWEKGFVPFEIKSK